jgi:hypothetical protein
MDKQEELQSLPMAILRYTFSYFVIACTTNRQTRGKESDRSTESMTNVFFISATDALLFITLELKCTFKFTLKLLTLRGAPYRYHQGLDLICSHNSEQSTTTYFNRLF